METVIAELARLDKTESLLEPEDALNLEESDVRQLLLSTARHRSVPTSPAAERCLWTCRPASLGFSK